MDKRTAVVGVRLAPDVLDDLRRISGGSMSAYIADLLVAHMYGHCDPRRSALSQPPRLHETSTIGSAYHRKTGTQ